MLVRFYAFRCTGYTINASAFLCFEMYRVRAVLVWFFELRCTGNEQFWCGFVIWNVRGTSGSGLILWSEMYGERAVLVWFFDLRCTGNEQFWFDFMFWDVRGTSGSGLILWSEMYGEPAILVRLHTLIGVHTLWYVRVTISSSAFLLFQMYGYNQFCALLCLDVLPNICEFDRCTVFKLSFSFKSCLLLWWILTCFQREVTVFRCE